jgi:ribosome-associated protein
MVITHEPEYRKTAEMSTISESENRSAAIRRSLLEACRCAQIADGFKGDNTLVLDLTTITPIFDFFVLSTGTSRRQMLAIAEEINKRQKETGTKRQGLDGNDQSQWIVQDYGDVVVHIFSPELREVYDLERLWADAPRVDWQAILKEEA